LTPEKAVRLYRGQQAIVDLPADNSQSVLVFMAAAGQIPAKWALYSVDETITFLVRDRDGRESAIRIDLWHRAIPFYVSFLP